MIVDTLPLLPGGKHAPHQTVRAAELNACSAVVLEGNGQARLDTLALQAMAPGDLGIETLWSGISTGTERMFWSGDMPPFPGLSYPLVPGYESVGRVIAAPEAPHRIGEMVFVPGAACYKDAPGLFGATASRLVVPADRVTALPDTAGPDWTLLALAATAHHAILRGGPPELVIGHGVLGRLAARITIALGYEAPTVWEIDPGRRDDAPYKVIDPADETRRDYTRIMDLSGDAGVLDTAIAHASRGGTITLAGFYKDRPSFAFPLAFMKEISLTVAAEWDGSDMDATVSLTRSGALDLAGLITHTAAPADVEAAYRTAFETPACLKMIIDWGARS